MIDTNLGGVFHTCRAAARGMMKRRSGSIVNSHSVVGVHGNPGQTNYAASKAGIIGFTKALARELGAAQRPRERGRARLHRHARSPRCSPEEAQQAMLANTPLGRMGEPEDVAAAVRFLCSDAGVVHHGRGPARRRRAGNVDVRVNGQTKSRHHGHRRRDAARQRRRDDVADACSRASPALGRSRTSTRRTTRPLRLRGEGLRPDAAGSTASTARRMDRFAHLVLAAARQAEADSGVDIAAEARARGRVDRDRHRRPQVVPGLLRHAARRAGPTA